MRLDLHDYAVYPRIAPAGELVTVTICPRGGHAAFPENSTVDIIVIPMEESQEHADSHYPTVHATYANGRLTFEYRFTGEQEYLLKFERRSNEAHPDSVTRVRLSVYAALPDLYALRPYRGDLHVHSNQSDGREAPETVVANYRKYGYDFLALTDHRRFEPSQRAIKAYAGVPTGIALFGGEEVHTPINHVHIVNFGGQASVNDWARLHQAEYHECVEARMSQLPGLDASIDPREYAACLVLFDKIREYGGLAIFPHPHWISSAYHVRDSFTRQLSRDHAFDAFELLGGQTPQENNMQTLIYEDALAAGIRFPVVGSSDSHINSNDSLYQDASVLEEYTIVLAAENAQPALLNAIKARQSVAVSQYRGAQPYVFGDYRFAKYAIFLINEYFPQHDELCAIEGGLLQLWLEGDVRALPMLELYNSKHAEFLEQCFQGIDK